MPISYMPTIETTTMAVMGDVPAGSWWSDETQAPLVANTPIVLSMNNTDFERHISLIDGTGIQVIRAGLYNFQWSGQIYNSDGGGTTAHAEVWVRVNGVDIPGSTGRISVTTNNRYALPAWNYFLPLGANDTVELMYQNSNVGIDVVELPAMSPTAASLIVTIVQVA